jgi:sigma-B regulation protein RsbU (phosphoserine phosphatase)
MLEIFYLISGICIGTSIVFIYIVKLKKQIVELDEQIQLLEQEKQIVVDFMHNMVEAIGEGVKRQELFQRIVRAAVLSTGSLSACVYEKRDEDILKGVAIEGLFPPQQEIPKEKKSLENVDSRSKMIEDVLRSEEITIGQGIIGSVAQSGRGAFIRDASLDPRIHQHDDPALQIESMMVAPIQFRNKLLGVIAVANPADGMSFTDTDFSLIESLAEQAGMAIHNSDVMNLRIERNKLDLDLSLASNVQQLLLPRKFPNINDFDIDTRYIPTQRVSGDFYDIIDLGPGRIGIAIADVSGKGIPASLIMAICQTNLRHLAKTVDSPSEVFKLLNKELSQEMRKDMFITLIYGVLDVIKEEFTFARAGHELPILVHTQELMEDCTTELLESNGMALGMVPSEIFDAVIEDKTVPFKKNDYLILYTDGLTETANENDVEYSNARLAEHGRVLGNRTSKEVNDALLQRLRQFAGKNNHADDLTLITIKRR